MREIKFRAWDRLNKKIVTSGLSINIDTTDRVIPVSFTQGDIAYCRDNDVNSVPNIHSDIELMQYTGLKDKNGVEIYEGDILAVEHQKYLSVGDERFYRNGYKNRLVKWRVSPHHNGWNIYDAPQTQFEVIGNIWENPELLEEGK